MGSGGCIYIGGGFRGGLRLNRWSSENYGKSRVWGRGAAPPAPSWEDGNSEKNGQVLARAGAERPPDPGPPRPQGGENFGENLWDGEAESQWIVAARLLCHLQYLVPYLSRLQRIHLPDRLELWCKAPGDGSFGRSGGALDACFWGRTGAPTGSRVTTGEVESAASSMDSDLEAFSHNPTHGSFASLAFQPNAMTNYVNQRFLSY